VAMKLAIFIISNPAYRIKNRPSLNFIYTIANTIKTNLYRPRKIKYNLFHGWNSDLPPLVVPVSKLVPTHQALATRGGNTASGTGGAKFNELCGLTLL
jgi:hypothetical protein